MRAGRSVVGSLVRGVGGFAAVTAAFCVAMVIAVSGPPTPEELSGLESGAGRALGRVCAHLPRDWRGNVGCRTSVVRKHPSTQTASVIPVSPDPVVHETPEPVLVQAVAEREVHAPARHRAAIASNPRRTHGVQRASATHRPPPPAHASAAQHRVAAASHRSPALTARAVTAAARRPAPHAVVASARPLPLHPPAVAVAAPAVQEPPPPAPTPVSAEEDTPPHSDADAPEGGASRRSADDHGSDQPQDDSSAPDDEQAPPKY